MSGTGPSAGAAEAGALDEEAYATRVEDAFIAERGTPFLLSPKDWTVVKGWIERGIPVDTAIRGIQEAFEKRRARGALGRISSISYCAGVVEERWELERRALVGQGDGGRDVAPEGVAPRLARLAEALAACAAASPGGVDAAAFGKAVGKTLEALRALDPTHGFDQLEGELAALEASLAKKLLKALDEEAAAALSARVSGQLADTASLTAEGRERIRRALTAREVRRTLGLPALTLFDA